MIEQKFHLDPLLVKHTRGYDSICELGAGVFRFFHLYDCQVRIGIELIQAYIDDRDCKEAIAIQGSIVDFEALLDKNNIGNLDVIAIIDVIEHLEKPQALEVITRALGRASRVLIFTPLGFDDQNGTEHYGFARPALRKKINDTGAAADAIEAQRHKSEWWPEDFEAMGFSVIVDKDYHGPGRGAIWAQWDKS